MQLLAKYIYDAHAANCRGDYSAAVKLCRQALQYVPGVPEGWYNLGVALRGLGKRSAAKSAFEESRIRSLGSAVGQNDIGLQFLGLGAQREAEQCFKKSIALEPAFAFPYSNLGKLLAEQRRFADAAIFFRKAIDLQPELSALHANLGGVLFEQRCYEEAATCFSKGLELDPNSGFLLGKLLSARMKCGDWFSLESELSRLVDEVVLGNKAAEPFTVLGLTSDLSIQRRAAEIWVKENCPAPSELAPIKMRDRGRKIRIGYYSADFHDHATSYLMAELFERHSRERFEFIGFSFGPDKADVMRQRVESAFDKFIDVRDLSDQAVAELSRQLEIDIAVDLKGYTTDCRPAIFAYRASPIQVSYLGYPGTTGAEYIDYVIADKVLIPKEHQQHYSESVVYMPDSYQVNDASRKISDRIFRREELGLPPTAFVFCCFNSNYKITPWTFESWMRILKQVDNSVLWLLKDNGAAVDNLRKFAAARGVDCARLVFADRLPLDEHLARHRVADLFLDTLPYNAHTTASDALWAGLPVLTCIGESFASRVASSLLNAIALPELITTSQSEFETLAIELATNPQRVVALKQKLEKNRLTTPLFDTQKFTRYLEAAYTAVYERHQNGLPPEHIYIDC